MKPRTKVISLAILLLILLVAVPVLSGGCSSSAPKTTSQPAKTTVATTTTAAPATTAAPKTSAPATTAAPSAKAAPDIKAGVKMPTTLAIIGGAGAGSLSDMQVNWLLKRLTASFSGTAMRILPGGQEACIRSLDKKESEIARCGAGMPAEAWNGVAPRWTAPVKSLRKITTLNPPPASGMCWVTLADSPINSLADLKNKKIGLGQTSSETRDWALPALKVHGITYENIEAAGGLVYYGEWGSQCEMLAEGKLDAVALTVGHPYSSLVPIDKTRGVKIIPLSDEEYAATIKAFPWLSEDTIPANTYKGQPKAIKTPANTALFMMRPETPNDVVYNILAATYSDFGKSYNGLSAGFDKIEAVRLSLFELKNIPMHPGAAAFWKDYGLDTSKLWVEP